MFLLSLQSNQEKVWKFPKFSTDTYWLEGELHYIKYLKEAFILRPIKLFYQCLLSVIKNFWNFKKKIKSSLKYFWKKCDLFTTLFSQKNLIRIQSLRYIFLVLSIPIWVEWWLKFSTPLKEFVIIFDELGHISVPLVWSFFLWLRLNTAYQKVKKPFFPWLLQVVIAFLQRKFWVLGFQPK